MTETAKREPRSAEQRKEISRRYYLSHKAQILERNKAWWKAHPEKQREKWKRARHNQRARRKVAAAKWRAKNADKIKLKKAEWQKRNRAKLKEYLKAYYQKHRAKLIQRTADWVKANCTAEWYEANKARINARRRRSHEADPDKSNKHARKWREKNREWWKAWAKSNPDKCRAAAAKRRALKLAATINLKGIKEWFRNVRDSKSVACYYCGKEMPGKKCHFDHIIPLARGGQHSVENLCVSCPPCNQSKSDKTPQVWIRVGQQLLPI